VDNYRLFRFEFDELPDYMKAHVIYHSKAFHIFWNYFRIPYKRHGLFLHRSKLLNSIELAIYFGKGEIGVSFYYKNLFGK
jgi:hypothetical protein